MHFCSRFSELSKLLEPGGPARSDKSAILDDAIRVLNHLRSEAKELKDANAKLEEEIKSLKVSESDSYNLQKNMVSYNKYVLCLSHLFIKAHLTIHLFLKSPHGKFWFHLYLSLCKAVSLMSCASYFLQHCMQLLCVWTSPVQCLIISFCHLFVCFGYLPPLTVHLYYDSVCQIPSVCTLSFF